MAFYATSFMFDGIPSETYSIGIINFDSSAIQSPGGTDVEIIAKSIYRKPVSYLFGTSQRPVLTFPLVFGSPNPMNGMDRNLIQSWLFGHNTYKKLQIFQDDLEDVYFNCILKSPKATYIGNLNYAFECEVVCDAPWAWEYPKTVSYVFPGNNPVNFNIVFNNASANNDYTYPQIDFLLNAAGNSFQLTNHSDNDRQFLFSGLLPNEHIFVDNDKQILTSSASPYRLSNFNLQWFRLLRGVNNLNIQSQIGTFTMTTQNARKVGG